MEYLLILGANSDIAKALAEKYASDGYNLYLAGRNLEELEETKQYITETYTVDVQVFKFDILEFYNHRNFYNNLNTKPIGVICATGYLGNQDRAQKDFLEAKKIIDTNYTGIVSILNIIANDFEKREEGFIIGISSVVGEKNPQIFYTYSSAKAGLTSYLSGLQNRLIKSNVQVLIAKPGFVSSKMTKDIEMPKKRTSTPEEFAESIYDAWQKEKKTVYSKDNNSLIKRLKRIFK